MNSWSDYSHRQATNNLSQSTFLDEQCLYDHLALRVKTERPEAVMDRFRLLFINATGYLDDEIWQTVQTIVNAPFIENDFKFILNRCCYIAINQWLMQPCLHSAIPDLVALFETIPVGSVRTKETQRLRELVRNFRLTEQYAALKRLAQVVRGQSEPVIESRHLGSMLQRYPCLYEHHLLTEDSSHEQRRRIRQIRQQAQHRFEQDLARYSTHSPSYSKRSTTYGNNASGNGPITHLLIQDRIQDGVSPDRGSLNPTLLSDTHLDQAIHTFSRRIPGATSYRDSAEQFLITSKQTSSYRQFKQDLSNYLLAAVDPKYSEHPFSHRLQQHLNLWFADYDHQPLSDMLMMGTCRRLLNFLVVDGQNRAGHAALGNLIAHLGPTATIGLLLKIVLICNKVKPHLEKQFALLFRYYELQPHDSVIWLVDALELLNVAFSLNFGALSL